MEHITSDGNIIFLKMSILVNCIDAGLQWLKKSTYTFLFTRKLTELYQLEKSSKAWPLKHRKSCCHLPFDVLKKSDIKHIFAQSQPLETGAESL